MSLRAYHPLEWPMDWERTSHIMRDNARFSSGGFRTSGGNRAYRTNLPLTMAKALERLDEEMTRLGAFDVRVTTNRPNSGGNADDPGVAVYFELGGKPRVFACDKWIRVPDNIASIAKHVDAIRAVERYGVGTREQIMTGYRLPALPASIDDVPWHEVLHVSPQATWTAVTFAYHASIKEAHPDRGGSREQMDRVRSAYAAAKAEFGK